VCCRPLHIQCLPACSQPAHNLPAVVDLLCCTGKTTLLAQLMCNQGEVVALDRSHAKVRPCSDDLSHLCDVAK
jgi:precorrin-6B methylase 2